METALIVKNLCEIKKIKEHDKNISAFLYSIISIKNTIIRPNQIMNHPHLCVCNCHYLTL